MGLLGLALTLGVITFVLMTDSPCPPGAVCDGAGMIIAACVLMLLPACLAACVLGTAIVLLGRKRDRNRAMMNG